LQKLREGASGEVYLVESNASGERMILHLLARDLSSFLVAQFLDEAKRCQEIHHPHLVRYLASGRTPDGRGYVLTDYVYGDDLKTHLNREGPLVPEDVPRLFAPLCEAMHEAHQRGVLHRDLRPHNIVVVGNLRSYQPKVTDVGSACCARTRC
jgi:serine/threonine protein kinase